VLKFNSSARRGLDYLHACRIIDRDDPQSVAALFLANPHPGLDKAAIGDFLGKRDFLRRSMGWRFMPSEHRHDSFGPLMLGAEHHYPCA